MVIVGITEVLVPLLWKEAPQREDDTGRSFMKRFLPIAGLFNLYSIYWDETYFKILPQNPC
jgi:hypothetical protein